MKWIGRYITPKMSDIRALLSLYTQVQVPKRRLEIFDRLDIESRHLFLPMTSSIIESLLQVFTSDDLDPLSQPLPVQGPSLVLESSRLVAEIRTRACQLVRDLFVKSLSLKSCKVKIFVISLHKDHLKSFG